MARDTVGTAARRTRVAAVVAGLAFGLRMTRGEAQTGMIVSDIRDLGPVGLVVARGALASTEPAFVRILVARDALGLQAEECRGAAAILSIVTLFAPHGRMSALKCPTGKPMVETRPRSARPTHELHVSSQMLDVALSALLAAVLVAMKPCALADARRQVVVATETRIGIDALTRRVALAAVGVALELGV